ncbi:hypothetical protein EWM64_g6412 [Hericium alpestre]|uniref:Uncharacterized protein n=1 Tax=Hericium alpestre TaxID=135208 RepID=A0A4Y9ZTR7_9AGAM|nr:hypothetical protein EWM64_g6412 [Hericium alpestre]
MSAAPAHFMFTGFNRPAQPSDADLATKALDEEASYRFPSWNANDAVTLGLSLRKRFRGSSRHQRLGKGLVISVQTIVGHTLFACTVGYHCGAAAADQPGRLEGVVEERVGVEDSCMEGAVDAEVGNGSADGGNVGTEEGKVVLTAGWGLASVWV